MRRLEVTEMKTVKWAMSLAVVREAYRTFAEKLPKVKGIPIVGWMVVLTEMVLVWWWTFLHNLPWPALLLDLLATGDSFTFRILDFLQQRLEWWTDAWGVRFMWLRESVEISVDKGITVLDGYFGRLQDWVLYLFDALLTPVRYAFKLVDSYSRSVTFRQTVLKEDGERRMSRKNFETEDEEDTEGWAEEDYLSDHSASSSKRVARKDKQGHLRQTNGGAAHSPVRRIFPGFLSKMGKGARDSGSDGGVDGADERKVLPREDSHSRSNSLRRLPRLFTSSNERKEEQANSFDANGESSPSGSKSDLQQHPASPKPISSPAIVRASAASPTGSPSDSPAGSPERRRRGFGRFSSKRQRSRK